MPAKSDNGWWLISTMPRPADDRYWRHSMRKVLLWNPCDGPHVYWLAMLPNDREFERQVAEGTFTHWRWAPAGPNKAR